VERLARFWREYASAFKGPYTFGALFLIATNALAVAIPGFVQHAVDSLGAPGADPQVAAQDARQWGLAIVAAGFGIIGVRTLSRTLIFNPGRTIEFRMKNNLFDRLLALPRTFYDRMRAGEIVSRGTNDANWMRALVGFGTLQLVNVVMSLTFTLGQMLLDDWVLTLGCVLPLVVAGLVLRRAIGTMFGVTQQFNGAIATLSNRILETYSGIGVLQAYGALGPATRRFDETNEELERLGMALARIRSMLLPVVSVTGNLCIVVVLLLGGYRVQSGDLTLGQLASFTVYVNLLVNGMTGFGWLVNAVQRGWLSLGRIYDVIDAPADRPTPTGQVPVPGPRGHAVEVRDLTFAYPLAPDRPSLKQVSFCVASGETVGLFGFTGAGKSTLLSLLARVYDAPAGTVFVDGVDVTTVPVEDWRAAVACVPQEPWLFSTTLARNIALSERGTSPDPVRLRAAVSDAALDVDLEAFPEGLETLVGERGITLSGGQRQRAALARAFYRDFRLLLLDDVMSAVDHATEKRLIDAVYRRCGAATTLLVSHRCSVLARADRVLVFDDGRLVADAHHSVLVQGDGPYARAWRLQQAAEALEGAP
jgi:ATP-binding cassette subfamily B protein